MTHRSARTGGPVPPRVGGTEGGGSVSSTQEGLESPARNLTPVGLPGVRETQEMQLLLEILPEAGRGKNTLASPFPPTRLPVTASNAQSMQEAN